MIAIKRPEHAMCFQPFVILSLQAGSMPAQMLFHKT